MSASRLARDRAEIGRLVIPGSRVSELEVVLPRRYRRLAIDGATDRAVWLDTSAPALLEVAVSADEVVLHALANEADFAAVLTNELKASTSPSDAIDWLESSYGALQVMESFRKGMRLAVSTFPLVIELRGRKSMERADVLWGAAAYRALDAYCRARIADVPPSLFGAWTPLEDGRYLSANGWYGAAPLDSGGYSLHPPGEFIAWIRSWLLSDTEVHAVDAKLQSVWPRLTRRDRVVDGNAFRSEWWLPSVGILVSMVDGDRAVVTEEGV